MKVNVRLFATLRDFGPTNLELGESFIVELNKDGDILYLLKQLKIPEDQAKIIMVNGVHQKSNYKLKENDTVSIFPPVGGGCCF